MSEALQKLPIEQRKQFLDITLGDLNDKEIEATDETETKFIRVFRNHLKKIYDVETIPSAWILMMNILYNNQNYPIFTDWLLTIPQPS
jgi:hypothetical protein